LSDLGKIYTHRLDVASLADFLPKHDFERQRVSSCIARLREISGLKKQPGANIESLDKEIVNIKRYLNREYGSSQ
jgi:hypothetical protein